MAPPWYESNGYGHGYDHGYSFNASSRRNNNLTRSQTPPNRTLGKYPSDLLNPRLIIAGGAYFDWQGLGDGRRAAVQEPPLQPPQPVGSLSPTQQSQAPSADDVNIGPLDDWLNAQDASAEPTPALSSPFRSSYEQVHPDPLYDGFSPALQVGNGNQQPHYPRHSINIPPNSSAPEIETSLFELMKAADSNSPTGEQRGYHQPSSDYSAAQSEYWSQSGITSSPLFHQTLRNQPPSNFQEQNPEQSFNLLQPGHHGNASEQKIDQGLFLDGFSTQRVAIVQAQLSESAPYHQVFSDQYPLRWAMLAHALGFASRPRQWSAYFGNQLCPYWLPSQADFSNWKLDDIAMLQRACVDNHIMVNWNALDSFGVRAQLLRDPMPPSAPYGSRKDHGRSSGHQRPPPGQVPALDNGQSAGHRLDQAAQLYDHNNWQAAELPGVNEDTGFAKNPIISQSELQESQPSQGSLLLHDASDPPPSASQPPVQNAALQQPRVAVGLPPPIQGSSIEQNDGGVISRPHLLDSSASAVALAAQTQQTQLAATSKKRQPQKTPRKRKALKRHEFKPSDMLQPDKDVITTIELLTDEDRKNAETIPDTSWWDPRKDITNGVPTTDEELRPFVITMKKSMMDTSKTKDKKGAGTSFNLRWSPGALNKNGYPASPKAMEAICWELAKMTRQLHQEGPGFLKMHDKILQNKVEKEQDLTFEQRINVMTTVFLVSKSRVDKLLKHENLGGMVAYPMKMLKNTIANRPYNDKRKEQNRRGKKGLKDDAAEANTVNNAAKTPATADNQSAPAETNDAVTQEEAGEGERANTDEDGNEEENEDEGAGEDEEDENEEDKDADEDEEGSDDENDYDEAGGSAGIGRPDATPDDQANQDGEGESEHRGESKTDASSPQSLPPNGDSSQGRSRLAPTAGLDAQCGALAPFQSPSQANTAGRIPQSRPLTAYAPTVNAFQHAPLDPSSGSRKRPATEHPGLNLPSAPKRSRNASCTGSSDALNFDKSRKTTGKTTLASPTITPKPL